MASGDLLHLDWYRGRRSERLFTDPLTTGRICSVDQYALCATDLNQARALLISFHHDQQDLYERRGLLAGYLRRGGTIVFNGQVVYPFVTGLAPFVPSTAPGVPGLTIVRAADHPIFAGVDDDDLTFKRGIAGIYARGGNPAPADAQVLNRIGPEGLAVDWLWDLPGGGRLLVHAGNDLWEYWHNKASDGRIGPQLVDWLLREDARS